MATKLSAGAVLSGTYRVVRAIGRGATGEVYEVRHLRTKASLALKLLTADNSVAPKTFQRFRREAEIASNLNHPNIVKVVDFEFLPDGRPFLVMELLVGRELTKLLEPRIPIHPVEIANITDQIASALSAAHHRGIVHRDLKPRNIFMMEMPGKGGRELVKLLDFGISKVHGGVSDLTSTNAILGTPNYMSPEQAIGRADEADGRADQFALAALVYEMLCGRMAFVGDSPVSVMYRVVHEQPPKLRALIPSLPPAVEKVVNRGLAKRPEDRFPTVEAFADALIQATNQFKRTDLVDDRDRLARNAAASRAVTLDSDRPSPRSPRGIEMTRQPPSTSRFGLWTRRLTFAGTGALALVALMVLWSRAPRRHPGTASVQASAVKHVESAGPSEVGGAAGLPPAELAPAPKIAEQVSGLRPQNPQSPTTTAAIRPPEPLSRAKLGPVHAGKQFVGPGAPRPRASSPLVSSSSRVSESSSEHPEPPKALHPERTPDARPKHNEDL